MKEIILYVALVVIALLALPWFFGAVDYSTKQSRIYWEVGR